MGDGGPAILVVDDSPTVRLQIRALLEEAGYRVVEADNGLEGLEEAPSTAAGMLTARRASSRRTSTAGSQPSTVNASRPVRNTPAEARRPSASAGLQATKLPPAALCRSMLCRTAPPPSSALVRANQRG